MRSSHVHCQHTKARGLLRATTRLLGPYQNDQVIRLRLENDLELGLLAATALLAVIIAADERKVVLSQVHVHSNEGVERRAAGADDYANGLQRAGEKELQLTF